jgi:hypothetical protein
MNITSWLAWAVVLFFQNISFTYVSRARSSGSLVRHLKASIFSNGIWIFSNMLMLGPMFEYLTGKHGVSEQILSGAVYTVSCVSGSLFAHFLAMKTEKGKNAVGYNKKYAQIPIDEWQSVKDKILGGTDSFEPTTSGATVPEKVVATGFPYFPGWGVNSVGSAQVLPDLSRNGKPPDRLG